MGNLSVCDPNEFMTLGGIPMLRCTDISLRAAGLRWSGVVSCCLLLVAVLVPRGTAAQDFLSVAEIQPTLDSLEHAALSSATSGERRSAAIALAAVGWGLGQDPHAGPPPYPGIVPRLARIYQQSGDEWVKWVIIRTTVQQADRQVAAAFLADVAAQSDSPKGRGKLPFPLQYTSVMALSHMGSEGQAELERLHSQGTVRNAMARARLDTLANHGFRPQ